MANYFTQEGLTNLQEELEYLKTTKQNEIAQALHHAASFGDLSENAAYHQAKEERKKLLDRIIELEQLLKGAKAVSNTATGGKISLGCSVVLECDGEKQSFQIVAPEESSIANNKISYQSPLGKCLIGKMVGEEAKVKTETALISYTILV
ncbi:MAG: transcription elongation factor GreA, partial [Candidatus Gribaldobacteria bacterium]|nr:transcription elongation factor GreA [Candidatus Gribaldobacteria bacterium]